jgi:hypothetical protein
VAEEGKIPQVDRFYVAVKDDKMVAVNRYLYVFDYKTGKELDKVPIDTEAGTTPFICPAINLDSAYFLYRNVLYE